MSRWPVLLASGGTIAALATIPLPASRLVVWNLTASAPTGLYLLTGKQGLKAGERVAIDPPPPLRRLMARRRYLPAGVPLIKRVAAIGGQRVCRHGNTLLIDGRFAALARSRDRAGRRLPRWSGCRMLRAGELFVLNPAASQSFDGRYFGVVNAANIIGRAVPVWTDEAGNGARTWFADPRATDFSTPKRRGT